MTETRFAIEDRPAVREAHERLQQALEQREEATARLLDAEEALEAAEQAEAEGREPEHDRHTLSDRIRRLQSDLRVAERAVQSAKQAKREAETEALEELEEEVKETYQEAAGRFWRRVHAAADAQDELLELYEEIDRLFGSTASGAQRVTPVPRIQLPALNREYTAIQKQTKLEMIRSFIRENYPWFELPEINGRH